MDTKRHHGRDSPSQIRKACVERYEGAAAGAEASTPALHAKWLTPPLPGNIASAEITVNFSIRWPGAGVARAGSGFDSGWVGADTLQ